MGSTASCTAHSDMVCRLESATISSPVIESSSIGIRDLDLRLQTREEAVEHHLRHAPDEPLTDAGDRPACLHCAAHLHDRRGTVGAQGNHGTALHESRPSLPF